MIVNESLLDNDILLEHARKKRKQPTEAEKRLWNHLRRKSLHGFKFKRQEIIEPYIVDFVCHEAKLIIEIDGDSHELAFRKDAGRQKYLEDKGFTVIRFWNRDVLYEMESVLRTIVHKCLDTDKN
jgi:very-short-patch-repair endonuclease